MGASRQGPILIVDDDRGLLSGLEEAFTEAGYETLAEGTFQRARHALHTADIRALITDVRLGDFNGVQLALLAKELHPGIRLIVVSGFDDDVIRREAEREGAHFVLKPVSLSDLIELVENEPASR